MKVLAIVIACGKDEQLDSGAETAFLSLGNRPVAAHSLAFFQQSREVDGIVVAVSRERVDSIMQVIRRFGFTKVRGVVVGGASRWTTLRTVFSKVTEPADWVMVHEASRPFLPPGLDEELLKAARRGGCAVAAHRIEDAVKQTNGGTIVAKTLPKGAVWTALYPQVFRFDLLRRIVETRRGSSGRSAEDESAGVRRPNQVRLVEAGPWCMKIRTAQDLAVATALLNLGVCR